MIVPKKRISKILVVGFSAALAATAVADIPKQKAADLSGFWVVFPDYDSSFFAHYAFLDDGRKCSLIFEVSPSGTETFAYLTRWEIDDHVMTTTFGLNSDGVRFGSTDEDALKELTDQRVVYKETGTVLTKRPDVALQTVCHLARAMLVNSDADSYIQDPEIGKFLGTWVSEGTTESECLVTDVHVTLRVFGATWPNSFDATYVQRSDVSTNQDCRGDPGNSHEEVDPVEIEGGIVMLTIIDGVVAISSSHRNETLTLAGDTMIGVDNGPDFPFRKVYPEIRYDAREGSIGWQAINRPLLERESQVLDLVREFANNAWFESTLSRFLEAAIQEAMKEGKSEVSTKRTEEFTPLERFDGMTFEEILQDTSSEIGPFLAAKIRTSQNKFNDCVECSEEELDEIREAIANLRRQRQTWVELRREL